MSKIILGIDPDSKAHGVAWYVDGKLTDLCSFKLMDIIGVFQVMPPRVIRDLVVHIEDVNGVSAAFGARDNKGNLHVKLKIAQHIGMCKQSQIELERVFDEFGIKVVKHKISKTWKKEKAQFEKVTGWTGRSNEDTRSAAYFGWLGVNMGTAVLS